MEKEKILKMAQNTKRDERTVAVMLKARELAGNISLFFVGCVTGIIFKADYILKEGLAFNGLIVFQLLMEVFFIYSAVAFSYQYLKLKRNFELLGSLLFFALAIGSLIEIIQFFFG